MKNKDQLQEIADRLDLTRTDKILETMIDRSDFYNKEKFDENGDIKKARLVVGAGNLHINTARAKLGALRMVGYQDNLGKLKATVQKRVRNERKYGRRS